MDEFYEYEAKLIPDIVEHIKANYNNCPICKRVADAHNLCRAKMEHFAATLFVESVKDYLNEYSEA